MANGVSYLPIDASRRGVIWPRSFVSSHARRKRKSSATATMINTTEAGATKAQTR